MRRGELWWATLPEPGGSGPGYRRPVLIVQSNLFNRSQISTVLVLPLTSNTRLAEAPGNVHLPTETAGLLKDSVANVSQMLAVDRSFLAERLGSIPHAMLKRIEDGLRLVLSL